MVQIMKRALIIGGAGFVGGYLGNYLSDICKMDVYVTKLPHEIIENERFKIYNLNILDKEDIVSLLFEIRPDYILHLAAQSSVGVAWKNPCLTIDINIKGSVNVMDAVRELFYKPHILLIGSGEEYGHIKKGEIPIQEETIARPGNIYAATKACQNMIGSIYADAYDMKITMVRAFNHIGPTQDAIFVVSDFCKQVAEIEKGIREPKMYVGNLQAKRDFTDVRDVVRAYALLIERGIAGETYNVGSGRAIAIKEVLDMIVALSSTEISIEIDKNKIRPVDVPIIEADITKIRELTGWVPQIPIQQTVKETLEYWRNRV